MYKLLKHPVSGEISGIWLEGKCIPVDESNSDYQEYLKWLEAGNEAQEFGDENE